MKIILKIFLDKWYLVLSSFTLLYIGPVIAFSLMIILGMFFSEMTGADSDFLFLLLGGLIGITVGAFVMTLPLMPIYQEITKQLGEEIAKKTRVIIYLFWWILLARDLYLNVTRY